MGYLSNPVGLRLGKNRAWLIKGTTDVYHQNSNLYHFLHSVAKSFFSRRFFRFFGFIFSHITFRNKNLSIYLVDARFETLFLKTFKIFIKVLHDVRYFKRNKLNSSFSSSRFKKRRVLMEYLIRSRLQALREPIFNLLQVKLAQIYLKGSSINSLSRKPFPIKIYTLSNNRLTTKALGAFILRKLKANNRLPSIFYPIMRGFKPYFKGLRIQCAGRFTRNQRASFRVYWFGKVSLNNFAQSIDYSFFSIPLKYGVGSIKIWIARTNRL